MDWEHTRAALAAYDESEPDRERLFESMETQDDFEAWARARDDAIAKVQDAFFEDCVAQDVPNSRDHCRLVGIEWLRSLA